MSNGPLGNTVNRPTGPFFSFSTKVGSFVSAIELAHGKR
jgi:hypothetical protein